MAFSCKMKKLRVEIQTVEAAAWKSTAGNAAPSAGRGSPVQLWPEGELSQKAGTSKGAWRNHKKVPSSPNHSKDHLVQSPCNEQGHQLDRIAQTSIQPNLEHFQREQRQPGPTHAAAPREGVISDCLFRSLKNPELGRKDAVPSGYSVPAFQSLIVK